jgi:hypothetical protein
MMMHTGLAAMPEGTMLPPLPVTVSETANARYWAGAGIEPPERLQGLLYPPMAANLTILAVQQLVDEPMLQTAQRLSCHRALAAPADLVVRARCTGRFEKRGRDYAVVEADVEGPDGALLWTSRATFTPVRR